MLPVIQAFMTAHQLPDVTIVADVGMISEANQKEIEAAGLSFILGMKIPRIPAWCRSGGANTPASTSRTGMCSPSPGPPGRTRASGTR
jgi:hypothetical protein